VELLWSCPREGGGAVLRALVDDEGVGARKLEKDAGLAGAKGYRGVTVLLLRYCWRPCSSFSANIERWNKRCIE